MRLFILWYLMLATSVLADGPVLYRDTTTKVTSRMTNWSYSTSTQDVNAGGNTITNLGTPSATSDAATKDYVDSSVPSSLSPYVPRIQDATPETATFTAVISETHIVDLSGGSFTANLPPVASGVGQIRFHVNGTAGQLTVDPNASELIDGKPTLKIRSGTTTITNDGTEWHILQRTARSPNRVDPAQITADQDPYNPPDWDNTVTHLYIDSDATRTLQGFAEGNFVEMDEVIVVNDGANDIVIAHDNATVASNSVLVDGSANFTLGPNKVAVLIRDGTVNKWRLYAMVTPLSLETSVQVMAASAAVSSTADRVRLDGNSATVTATLFNCDVTSNGSKVRFVAVDVTNPLSVAADAGDTIIGGAPTFTAVGDSATLICYGAGAEWEVY